MRIAIFTDTFLPQVNGVVTATLSLVRGLADRGHKVYLIIPKYKKDSNFKYKNVIIKRIGSVPAFFYPGFRFSSVISLGLLRYLKKQKIELIHFQVPMPLGFQAILFSRILKVPLVGTFHTLFQDPQYLKHIKIPPKLIMGFSWGFARRFYSKCDLITCPTEDIKEELVKQGFNKRIVAISNGIDKSVFSNSKMRETRNKYNPQGPLLLFIGRISHDKNLDFLIDSFKIILKKNNRVKLLIVGGGPQLEDLKKKVNKENLSREVIFTGEISHQELVRSSIISACDVFVSPSLTETQGISILEAQVNGVVCVGMNRGGVRNIIKNNYNGFLIEPGNKGEFAKSVLILLNNKKKYSEMRKNTLEEIKKHDLRKVIGIWEREYSHLIKNNKKSV